jgi:hypothetical protein
VLGYLELPELVAASQVRRVAGSCWIRLEVPLHLPLHPITRVLHPPCCARSPAATHHAHLGPQPPHLPPYPHHR